MNIFDQHPINITRIITTKRQVWPAGHSHNTSAWRNHWDNLPYGFFSLIFTISGEAEYQFSDRILRPGPNDVMFLDNYTPFRFSIPEHDYSCYAINYVADSGFITSPAIFTPQAPEKYIAIFHEMIACFSNKIPGYELLTTAALLRLLAAIKYDDSLVATPQSKMDKAVFAIDYMKAHFMDSQLSVEQIAEQMQISTSYLRRIFDEVCGISPNRYIKDLRINHAIDLLHLSNLTIAEIGRQCGFTDTSYFCREFKKKMGQPPYAYRNRR